MAKGVLMGGTKSVDRHWSREEPMPTVYIASYEAALPGQRSPHRAYHTAIQKQTWPYSYGDDPSFFCHLAYGTRLTWGVSRGDMRNRVEKGDVVLFFSFRQLEHGPIEYRFCAVARVEKKIRQTDIWTKAEHAGYRDHLNLLVRPDGNARWAHHEPGVFPQDWHNDWLWRFVSRNGTNKQDCEKRLMGDFVELNRRINGRLIQAGLNYVVFSGDPAQTRVMMHPPVIAYATPGEPEHWISTKAAQRLRQLTLGTAETYVASRTTLRTQSTGRPHPSLRWSMSAAEMNQWLQRLVHVLSLADNETPRRQASASTTKMALLE